MDNKLDDEYETLRKFNAKNKIALWLLIFSIILNLGCGALNLLVALDTLHNIF